MCHALEKAAMTRHLRPAARKLLSVILCLAILVTALPVLAQDPVASINTGAANLRSGPGLNFGSIAALPFGFGVNLTARNSQGTWVYVTLGNGIVGWVSSSVLFTSYPIANLPINDTAAATPLQPTATVVSSSVNMRARAETIAPVVTVLPQGQTVELIGRNFNGSWANVRLTNGQTGWVIAGALRAQVPVRSLAPTDGSIAAPIAPAPVNPGTGNPGTGGTAYVVRAGDTLAGIARAYGVNVYTLAQRNGIYNINLIYAGQTLYIP
jgi:uncharacterized protein YraI